MDQNAQAAQPVTDDAELAKVLSGMNDTAATNATTSGQPTGLQFEETALTDPAAAPIADVTAPSDEPAVTPVADPVSASPVVTDPALETIKKDALAQLRPLVDKLELPADEKFDTLLLIIRSTDDHGLVSAAYQAAKAIEDETKRAQALLDVIKEIDYFAAQPKAA